MLFATIRSKLPIALVVLLVAVQAAAIPVASAQEEQGAVQLRLQVTVRDEI